MTETSNIDLLVIGGGINGTGIARDAAGRGLNVVLCEKDDLAQGTSSRSGKLIHGGLRYLEHYEFRLVREALIEREVLLNAAPHIVWPMRFVLPHAPEQRPAWLVRLGLFLYDHLGGRQTLPGCRKLDLWRDPEGQAIQPAFRKAFEYSDCWVDDARMVVLNALDAKARGARILTRTKATSARRSEGAWEVELIAEDGRRHRLRSRAIANAAGPWVEQVITGVTGLNTARKVRLVKGSHVIVPKFWDGPQAYLFQNHDKRVIFVNPYQGEMALIGTTDIPFNGAAEEVTISEEEIAYLLAAVNCYSRRQLTREDVLHHFSGVRPLYDDQSENPSAVTRDYVFELDGTPPLLSVFGGKITTFRKLAEHALQKLRPVFPQMGPDWTAGAVLPGGDLPMRDPAAFEASLRAEYPWLPDGTARRFTQQYGTLAHRFLKGKTSRAMLGRDFGGGFTEAEADYLTTEEWAVTAEDMLVRRTKCGLHMSAAERAALDASPSRQPPDMLPSIGPRRSPSSSSSQAPTA